MHAAPVTPPRPDIPPIVLLVDDDRDALATYSAFFEASGVWAATSTAPDEALDAVEELKPDLVVTALGFDGEAPGADLVHSLRSRAETRHIPVILLSPRNLAEIPDPTRVEADLCLVKPVAPHTLLATTRRLIDHSREARRRLERARSRAADLSGRATAAVTKARHLAAAVESRRRLCPQCANALDWIERGRIGGSEYDYYRWCLKGCGLYCYDRHASKWVKLA
jgi:DNA-binding response OmpR family regulator